jgi:ATP-dependent DNA helicase PIF1
MSAYRKHTDHALNTGKSTILKAFVKQLTQRGQTVRIVAPTNLAALNVGGQTTWNFAGWTPDSLKKSLEKLMENAHGNEVWKRFDSVDVLVIDEIRYNQLFDTKPIPMLTPHTAM